MTIGGALSELDNLLKADDIPFYYKPSIKAVMDIIALSSSEKPNNSTTKNDLEVDCISRDSAIKALDYDIESFEFKSGVSKHMDDIAKLLNTIYEIQVNNIKALTSVTPQEQEVIDKIRAEILRISSYGGYELGGYKDGYINAMANVLSIIDKHTIGSEKE